MFAFSLVVVAVGVGSLVAQQQRLVRGSQLQVAAVDVLEAMKHSDEFRDGRAAMKADIAKAEGESKARGDLVLTAEDAKPLASAAGDQAKEYQDWKEASQRRILAREGALYEGVLVSINQAITQFAKENTIQVVIPITRTPPKKGAAVELLNTRARSVQYQDPAIPIEDITAEVIVILNQTYRQNKAP